MLYLVMGALVFGTLELPGESLAYTNLLATKNAFLENNSCVTELDFYKLVKVSMDTLSKKHRNEVVLVAFSVLLLLIYLLYTTHKCLISSLIVKALKSILFQLI